MDRLDEISVEELQDALANVDGNKPTQRLLAAIAHKNGQRNLPKYKHPLMMIEERFHYRGSRRKPTTLVVG